MIARYTLASNMRNNLSNVSKKHINNLCKIHSHEFYELEYIISGSGKIDNKDFKVGDSCFVPADYGEFTLNGDFEALISYVE